MISVVGEALIDLVITPDGAVDAKLGGAPFNTARACARLGAPTQFVAAISRDRFGSQLAEQLHADGVDVTQLVRVDVPTRLTDREVELLTEFAEGRGETVGNGKEGLFSRIKSAFS